MVKVFPGTRDTKERLMSVTRPDGFDQLGDGLTLVALGLVVAGELKLAHGEDDPGLGLHDAVDARRMRASIRRRREPRRR